MNESWETLFPLTNLRKIPRQLSDHNPLMLCTDQDKIKKKKGFSFENSWLKHEDFLPKIREIWGKQVITCSAIEKWCIKLGRVKKFLKGWGQNLRGQVRCYKHRLQEDLGKLEEMEKLSCLSTENLDKKTFIHAELQKIQEEEEEYWHKRSNLNWLLKGDNNTDYFHKIANGKKRKNTIFSLQHEGESIEEDGKILEHATAYYKDLFSPAEKPLFKLSTDTWDEQEKVTKEENDSLCRPFTLDEIKKVIFSMEKNTAPGPDHIPIEFYQTCWDIIKEDIMDMFLEFGSHNLDLGRLNYEIITLIPKLKEASKIQQYRPICLLNVSFKVFTKALMLRFEDCMSRIINVSQSVFIKGRNIMDGVMALHEVLHDTKSKKRDGLILKLDFEKAYDKISWEFLSDYLRHRVFCEDWCKWIKVVVTSGTLSVKVNDVIGSYFQSGKGVRQGDPLSPLLFNLVADALAKIIQQAQRNGLIQGLIPEYVENGIAILQYADDTILCLQDEDDSAQNMKPLLYLFEQMSGLKINFDKSEVIIISQDERKTLRYAELFNCSTGQWPLKYLGVPVCGSRLHIKDWLQLDEKLHKRLGGWKGNSLSFGGRLTLLNACLSSIPIYSMSMYLLPKTIHKRLDKTRKRFFWQGGGVKKKYYLVKWSKVAIPKSLDTDFSSLERSTESERIIQFRTIY